VPRYERAIVENPRTTFVLGHAGALQMEEALALAKRYTNVYLETSCQSLGNVKRILDEGPGDRILFGSDWPFYHQAIPLAKVLLASEGRPALRRQVLWENAARLFGISEPANQFPGN
jgi:predicted TIM-barrel fold metal-dependent hydrolase